MKNKRMKIARMEVDMKQDDFNIVMGIFELAQNVVNGSAGIISGSLDLNAAGAVTDLQAQLEATIDELLNGKKKPESQFAKARRLIETALANGPVLSVDMMQMAEEQGISPKTLNRAKDALGVISIKRGEKWSANRENTIWTIVQHLCHSLDTDGIPAAAQIVLDVGSSHAENAKALSYRAYIAAERMGWTEEALAYNRLVTAWPEIIEKADELRNRPAEQLKLNM